MVKQKIVIRMNANLKQDAFEIASREPGITSVTKEEENIVVVGDGVDAVELLRKIRKKTGFMTCIFKKNMGYANLVSLEDIKEKEEENKGGDGTIWSAQGMNYWPQQPYIYEI